MDIAKIKRQVTDDDDVSQPLGADDMDTLEYVLKNVRGSYPDQPYRQADFDLLTEDE